jgi:hypothetical protein
MEGGRAEGTPHPFLAWYSLVSAERSCTRKVFEKEFCSPVQQPRTRSSCALHAAAGCCLTAASSSESLAPLCTLTPIIRGLAQPSWLTCGHHRFQDIQVANGRLQHRKGDCTGAEASSARLNLKSAQKCNKDQMQGRTIVTQRTRIGVRSQPCSNMGSGSTSTMLEYLMFEIVRRPLWS